MDRILLYSFKIHELLVAKVYGNNGTFYGDAKYRHSSHKALL